MTTRVLVMQDSAVLLLLSAVLNVSDLKEMKKVLTVRSVMTSHCMHSCFHSPVFRSSTVVMKSDSSTTIPTKMILTRQLIPVTSTEETSTGISQKTVIVRELSRTNSSLFSINWNTFVWSTAYSTAMYRSARSIPGMMRSLLLSAKMMKRSSSVSITSVNLTRLHGSTKTTVCTLT